jgi:hypothetical protein
MGWKFYTIFPLVFYPACFLLTWFRHNDCNPNPAFNLRPCTFMSKTEIAIFSFAITIVSTLIVAWRLGAMRR